MKGLRIIPMFLLFTALSCVGAFFVEANAEIVSIRILTYETPALKQGMVILFALLFGMLVAGLFCSIELLALYVQNRRLKHKLAVLMAQTPTPVISIQQHRTELKVEPPKHEPTSVDSAGV